MLRAVRFSPLFFFFSLTSRQPPPATPHSLLPPPTAPPSRPFFVPGIFVQDILEAVPIDKYFELFKPGAGGEGGFIRVAMAFYPDRKALEKGAAGARYHGVADEGVPFGSIAELIGHRLGVPVRSRTLAEANRRLGWFGPFIAVDNPASSIRTQQDLGWRPAGPALLPDLDRDIYFDA